MHTLNDRLSDAITNIERWPNAWKLSDTLPLLRDCQAALAAAPGAATPGPADERERCALLCDDLAWMMENGAGEVEPGQRLRQAARNIRDPLHKPMRLDSQGAARSLPVAQEPKP